MPMPRDAAQPSLATVSAMSSQQGVTILNWFSFILLGFATFRLTRLLVYDNITHAIRAPFHDVREVRQADGTIEQVLIVKGSGIRAFMGELLSCHWCTGMWCALLLYTGLSLFPPFFLPLINILAVAAVAALIEEKLNG